MWEMAIHLPVAVMSLVADYFVLPFSYQMSSGRKKEAQNNPPPKSSRRKKEAQNIPPPKIIWD